MKTKTNLSGIVSATSNGGGGGGGSRPQIGKVFGVITTKNTPTKALFEKYNGWSGIGTVFYMPYDQYKYFVGPIRLEDCQVASPLDANFKKYPLVGELVFLIDGPSPASQVTSQAFQKYYVNILNLWNNIQQNSPSGDFLGKTFVESVDVKNLTPFEGDVMIQGRKGSGIRFGTTVKSFSTENEWSSIGNDGDPITIIVNGYVTSNPSELTPNIEEINKEKSSIYMTSTQRLPLVPGALIKNPFNSSTEPRNYTDSQLILNSDRITLNSKKDEVLIFSKSNIELSTDNVINLNAGEIIHLNIDNKNSNAKILLGTDKNGAIPSEPVLLGGKTHDVLEDLISALATLASYLMTATVPSPEGAVVIPSCRLGGNQLLNDVLKLCDKLSTITSEKVYTI